MRILYIEPFSAGSHAQFAGVLQAALQASWERLELPGRHWKWRMRSCAAYAALAEAARVEDGHDLVLASSYVPLAELVGLLPSLASVPRVLYFHENQLSYPSQGEPQERDLHYGVTQMVSALAATRCVFNSSYNQRSFLGAAAELLARMPKPHPPGWVERIAARSLVLPVPLALSDAPLQLAPPDREERALGPILLWNHRWEHDKDPETFFEVLIALAERGVPFRLAVVGERYRKVPPIFEAARARLSARFVQFGHLPDRASYEALLRRCHVVVSTARHEFFGVSMLEAVHFGARPLAPRTLVYPELFDAEFLYDGAAGLAAALEHASQAFCAGRDPLRADRRAITRPFLATRVAPAYQALFEDLVRARKHDGVSASRGRC